MAGESYQRAYGAMVSVQMLAELEEVVQYKLIPERRNTIRKMWWDRLQVRDRIIFIWKLASGRGRSLESLKNSAIYWGCKVFIIHKTVQNKGIKIYSSLFRLFTLYTIR